MDIKSFQRALAQIAEERGISSEKVIETIEVAIATAYKKDYGEKGQKIKAKFNPVSGDVKFWQIKLVMDNSMLYTDEELEEMQERKEVPQDEARPGEEAPKKYVFNEEKHIMLADAKKDYPKIKAGEEIEIPLVSKQDYGRIAAQTAKQVILQKIREAEKETISAEYKSKEGEIISGIVQRIEGQTIFIDIGKTLGLLNREEQISGEFYRPGQRIKLYILKVEDSPKGSVVVLSRAYPKLISKLFELEVPEIASGSVVIKSIAREPGFRTKIAVVSNEEGVDPIGACVGQRGTRIMAVINELGGEKIDVVHFEEKPEKYITNALAPAKVVRVEVQDKNTAVVFVPVDQLSLAIGKDGRNVRLASNLTGWKIDIKTSEVTEEVEESSSAKASEDESADSKPKKKAKKAKKTKEEVGTDGEAEESTPEEVDDATEEKPAETAEGPEETK
ncbi:MAG: transcription termination factor NusA [Candidatus Staskawiczbacteria bacterium RIFOXYD1_FULL_39_28]|uniref:Transcription termination/antitermination protein NusA n=1 Tax=Candidatus Staskawiczbacteria bacterium RIFOXYC1_FULL_38_18 TaxID=1802229 RepID=A0A1G2JCG5_9BACT|nr:MAG: transcription termination factor NusA [Candidatus Staskawiczbacteria bacterium RIFOXYC1_FULL_38_18]OGZ90865.1 MAG: transcription termination factor NusA [Candidatus Staskawiczbacteria bacterium RIFOXYD1_FULL_39_28]